MSKLKKAGARKSDGYVPTTFRSGGARALEPFTELAGSAIKVLIVPTRARGPSPLHSLRDSPVSSGNSSLSDSPDHSEIRGDLSR